jgi:hypothetical protein
MNQNTTTFVGRCQVMKDFLQSLSPGAAVPGVISDRRHPYYGHEIFKHFKHYSDGTVVTCELCLTQNESWVRGQMTQKEYEIYIAESTSKRQSI